MTSSVQPRTMSLHIDQAIIDFPWVRAVKGLTMASDAARVLVRDSTLVRHLEKRDALIRALNLGT
jgi:hypothetical protein